MLQRSKQFNRRNKKKHVYCVMILAMPYKCLWCRSQHRLLSTVRTDVGILWLSLIPMSVCCKNISNGYIIFGYAISNTKYAHKRSASASPRVLVVIKHFASTYTMHSVTSSDSAMTMNSSVLLRRYTSSSTSTQPSKATYMYMQPNQILFSSIATPSAVTRYSTGQQKLNIIRTHLESAGHSTHE